MIFTAMLKQSDRLKPSLSKSLSEMGEVAEENLQLYTTGLVLRPSEEYDEADSDWVFEVTYRIDGHPLIRCASQALHLQFDTDSWDEAEKTFISKVQDGIPTT